MKENIFFVIFLILLSLMTSWAITIGLIKIITVCFSLEFSLLKATGIWIILLLIKDIFTSHKGGKEE